MFDTITGPAERRMILSAVRARYDARAAGRPVLPAVYTALEDYRCGILAPVLASLIALVEACAPATAPPENESRLLALLEDGEVTEGAALSSALRGAIHSARIMIAMALDTSGAGRHPLRFAVTG